MPLAIPIVPIVSLQTCPISLWLAEIKLLMCFQYRYPMLALPQLQDLTLILLNASNAFNNHTSFK